MSVRKKFKDFCTNCTKSILKRFYQSDLDKVIIAIKKDDTKKIKWYNKVANFNFNRYNENGDTPALYAVKLRRYEIVKYIFTKAPNLIKEDKTTLGDTALMLATFNGDLEMVQLQVEDAKLDVNCQDNQGFTPFIAACANGYIDIVYYFIFHAQVNTKKRSYDKQTAVHRAAFHGNTKVLKLIYNATTLSLEKKDKRGNTPQHYAAMKFNIQTIRFICDIIGMEHLENDLNNDEESVLDVQRKNLEKVSKRKGLDMNTSSIKEIEFDDKKIKDYIMDVKKTPFQIQFNKDKKVLLNDSESDLDSESDDYVEKSELNERSLEFEEKDPFLDKKDIQRKKSKLNMKKNKKHSMLSGPEGYMIMNPEIKTNIEMTNLAMENIINPQKIKKKATKHFTQELENVLNEQESQENNERNDENNGPTEQGNPRLRNPNNYEGD